MKSTTGSRRVIVHIGMEKTGTTFLQNIFGNLENCKSIYYTSELGGSNHFHLAVSAMEFTPEDVNFRRLGISDIGTHKRFKDETVEVLRAEYEKFLMSEAEVFLLSNEHLSSRLLHEDDIDRFGKLFQSASLPSPEIVVVLRRQSDFLFSRFSTEARGGRLLSFDLLDVSRDDPELNYLKLVRRWSKNNVVSVLPYSRKELLEKFVERLELDFDINRANSRLERKNPASSVGALLVLNQLNQTDGRLSRKPNIKGFISKKTLVPSMLEDLVIQCKFLISNVILFILSREILFSLSVLRISLPRRSAFRSIVKSNDGGFLDCFLADYQLREELLGIVWKNALRRVASGADVDNIEQQCYKIALRIRSDSFGLRRSVKEVRNFLGVDSELQEQLLGLEKREGEVIRIQESLDNPLDKSNVGGVAAES